ncbi:AI-2E family transporter [Cellulomonas sp. P22]|uniref:AI-2E family transporter n=1 Tax=Cellulomonas sp. P22 TaxID=3373189 RepID=UPI00379F7BCE
MTDSDTSTRGARPAPPAPTVGRPTGTEPGTPGRGHVADAVPYPVRVSAAWSWRLLLIAAATGVGIWLLGVLKTIVVPVAVALLLAVLLAPVVRALQRWLGLPRAVASATALLGMLAVVVGLLTLAGSSVARGFAELGDQAALGIERVTEWLAVGPLQVSADQLADYLDQIQSSISSNSGGLVSGALSVTTTLGHVAAGAVIALFCTFFFLMDPHAIWSWVVGLLPVRARERAHQAARRGVVTLGAYTRTQILVASVDAVGIGVGAAILGIPLALPLAVLVFLGSFVPILGALLTGSIAVLVALVAQGPGAALIMLAIVLAVQQIEGHVLQPFLMGHAVSLHPVAVLLAVATGTLVAGIVGALFAVPLVAVVNTVVLYLHGHDKFPQLGTDDTYARREPSPAGTDLDPQDQEVRP